MNRKPGLQDVLPLSPLQEGLLFHALLDEDGRDIYTVSMGLRFDGPLDVTRLCEAGQALLDRHPNLRAGFRRTGKGAHVAAIPHRVPLPWAEHDLRGRSDAEQSAELERLGEAELLRRFDMTRPPLLRLALARLAEDSHVLTITHHHILLDGWSSPLLVKELLELYADPAALPPPTPYKSYLAWLSRWDSQAAIAAWQEALAGLEEPTVVSPAQAPRDPVPPSFVDTALPQEVTARLTALAADLGVTVNTLVQAGWGLLLGRVMGRDDVVFGATVSGRPADLPGVESMIGLFINTVPVRVRLRPAETVREFLTRLQDEQAALMDHQYLGLAHIQRLAGLGELFDTLTVFESYPAQDMDEPVPGLRVTQVADTDATHFPLVLVAEPGERLQLEIRHRADVFDRVQVQVLLDRLCRILTGFADERELPIARLDVLDPVERQAILHRWSGDLDGVEQITFPQRFEQIAAAFPEHDAVVCEDERISYAELDARSLRLARRLAARGIGPGDVVGVALPRSVDLIVGLAGVLRSGAAYLALDLEYPVQRLRYMLDDAKPRCVVSHAELAGSLPGQTPVLQLSADDTDAQGAPRPPRVHDAAYVIYTSGSTGLPKGVVVPHEGTGKLLATQQRRLGVDEHSRVLHFASASFDLAYWEMCHALLSGGTLVVVPAERRVPGPQLTEYLAKHELTLLALPPSVLDALPAECELPPGATLLVGTEEVAARLVKRFGAGRRMFNAYGPTETSVNATLWECTRAADGTVPIGVPDPGQLTYVLDWALSPVPPEAVGELYIGGFGLAHGYLGQPGLSSGRFVADPFAGGGARMYRTGDLVRWNTRGELEFVGRADHQVKIRGFRVELGEIEAAVARQSGVRQAAVVVRTDRGVRRAVAYVVPDNGKLDVTALRTAVAAQLPDYMVPGAFVMLDAMPVTVNNKLDRAALPAPDFAAQPIGRAPRTPRERVLCGLFADVLGLPEVGVDDDFFALGGDSIVSMQLAGRARTAGLVISPRQIFQCRTPANLVTVAGVVTGSAALPATDVSLVALTDDDRRDLAGLGVEVEEVLPLSPLQAGLLFHSMLDDDGPDVYTVQIVLHLDGPVDVQRLRAAAQLLLNRHGNLRASFHHLGTGKAVGVVAAGVAVPWAQLDLSGLDNEAREQAWQECLRRQGTRFDPATAPLLRLALVTLGPDRHRLVLTHHHLLLDGWSRGPLLAELDAFYRLGERAPEAVKPFRNYLAWLSGQDRSAAERTWRSALAELGEPTLVAPADRDRLPLRPATVEVELPAARTEALVDLARGRGLTLNTVIQAAWGLLLARLTGRDDVVFGATVAGRPSQLPGVESMIGLFINTVPVRVRLDQAEPVGALLARLQDEQVVLMDQQYLGLPDIQRAAGLGDLFDTLLVFENYPDGESGEAGGLPVTGTEGIDATHYPLALIAEPGPVLRLALEYRPDIFAPDRAEQIASWLLSIVDSLIAAVDAPLGRVELLDVATRSRMLAAGTGESRDLRATTLPELFAAQVARTPYAVALVADSAIELTYLELDARVELLARVLAGRGAGPETVVAIALPRSIDLVVAIHATVRAGAAYLPLDLDHPAGRIAAMLADARPVTVVTLHEWEPLLGDGVDTVVLDEIDLEIPDAAPTAPQPEHPAYVIYTSGSTGVPKGVAVAHSAIVNRLLWMQHEYGLVLGDRVLQKTPAGFDVSVWEFFWPLITGATLVVAKPHGHRDPAYLADLILRHEVTVAHFVPSMLAAFLSEVASAGCVSLRHIVCSGEALPSALARRCIESLPACDLHNLYGPTEAAVDVTAWPASRGTGTASVPIGDPVWNTRVYVLDSALRPVPQGVPGELYLAGVQLARGYLDRPGLTADRFVANPFGPAGTRMYRTGDQVRWTAEGALEFLGRGDGQVKIRGLRVELSEIEASIAAVAPVGQVAVLLREDRPGVRHLVAYLTALDGFDEPAMRQALAARLPDYMVPAAFIVLAELPVSVNGKLDRRALPAPDFAAATGADAPATAREQLVCDLFAEVLGLPRVGANDDFFALGGDSIVSIQLVSRARSAGLSFSPRQVFQLRTPSALAGAAGLAGSAVARSEPLVELTDAEAREIAALGIDVEEVLPLSPLQAGLLFHASFDTEGIDVYTVQMVFDVPATTDPVRLRAAGQGLLARHANLRASFHHLGTGRPVAVVARRAVLPWAEIDLSTLDPGAEGDAWRRCLAEEARRFDPTVAPLLRMLLARVPGGYRLILTHQHMVLDGWSRGPLMAQLSQLYASGGDTGTAIAPYRDFLAWLADAEKSAAEQEWGRALAGVTEATRLVPADAQRVPAVPELAEYELPQTDTAALTALARARGLTVNTLVQAAWAVVLGRLTGRDDVVFGATVSGRPAQLPGVESMIGLFINTVPVRVVIDPSEPADALLARLQEEQSALMEHQHLGLADIQRIAGVGELFDTLLIVENYPDLPDDGEQALLTPADAGGRDATHYPLTWVVEPGERLRLVLEYRPDLFERATAEQLTAAVARVLAAFATRVDRPVGQLELVTRQVPAAAQRFDLTVAQVFEAQAAATPQQTALVSPEVSWSFAEVNARANQLARLIVSCGAGAEDIVALALPRTADHLVAILAVLKSGAAYLPLDLSYPPARIEAMLADARPKLLITTTGSGMAESGFQALALDDPATNDLLAAQPGTDLTDAERIAPARAGHPAYVIYTSGSTGRPKGVVVTHRNLVNLFHSHRAQLHRPAQEETGRRHLRVAHAWSFAFDASWQPQLWLLDGHAVHIVTEEVQRDPERLAALIIDEGIDFIELTPSHFAQVAELGVIRDGRCCLAVVGVGGEAVSPALWQRLGSLPGTQAYNLYGPTEATVDALSARIGDTATPVIGRAVAGARAYVLDAALQHMPVGVPGELYVAGAGLARGYLGRAGLTAERFVADPYGPSGERMYRTGDLVRWTVGGQVEYLGRVDEQVKIRGFRVELGEIESVLGTHPGVAQAVVMAREDRPGIKRLVGYVVARPGGVDLADVARHAAAALPEYMVPSVLVPVDRLPTLANGKLDRAALPAPDLSTLPAGRAPRDEREQTLCAIFTAALGVPDITIDDDFFSLGGDSIVAMQLVSRARAAGWRITPRQVFAQRTAAGLAAVATRLDSAADTMDDGVGEVPLTPVMHWLQGVDGPIDGFNQSAVVQVPANLGWQPLLDALQTVTDRHDMMRTRLDRQGDGWTLVAGPPGSSRSADWTVRVDVTGADAQGMWDAVARHAREAQAALDPGAGMMARAVWFDAGPHQPGRLLLLLHHLIVDGVSWRVLLPEIGAAWRDAVAGRQPDPSPTGTSFRRWASGLRACATDPQRVAELPMWTQLAARGDALPLRSPLDPTRDTAATLQDVSLSLPVADTEALLTRAPAALHATVNDVLLGGLSLAVAKWRRGLGDSGNAVLVSLEGHGREEHLVAGADLSGTVGWFTNIFPVCLDAAGIDLDDAFAGGPAAAQAVTRVREHLVSLPDNGMGYGLLRYLNPETAQALGALPEPPIQFNYMGRFDFPEAADWEYSPEAEAADCGADDAMPETYCLVINAQTEDRPGGPQLTATWAWPEAVLTGESVRDLARIWFEALQALVIHTTPRSK